MTQSVPRLKPLVPPAISKYRADGILLIVPV
jgi:hypothetical protein